MHLHVERRDRCLSYRPVLLMLAVLVGISIIREWWLVALMALEIYGLLLHYLGLQASAERQYAKKVAEEVTELHLRTIEGLASAINAKDNTTHEHLARVVVYAEAIGKEMGLAEDELKALRAAALLHDIGKLAVPEYIISKPGRLTEEEFEKMKIHTIVGAEILERVRFPYPVVPIVRSHHERWNGSGYPDGLKGEEIPVGARILAVVDSFDALSSDRQYRRALSRQDAMEVIKKNSGILYDPKVVAVFEAICPQTESIVKSLPQFGEALSTRVKVEKGLGPMEGLSVESVTDTSSALCSIAQARKELQILYELTQALGNSLSVEETLRLLADKLRELIPYDTIAVYLTHDGKLVPRFVEGVNDWLVGRVQIPLGEGVSGWVAAQGKCSLNGNPAVEPSYVEDPPRFGRFRSALSVPLDSAKGIIGALTLYSLHVDGFTVDHLRILKSVGMKAGSTLQNALIYEATGKSAETDPLTGLANARPLWMRLEQETSRAERDNTFYSVFVVDLNGLKRINDTRGHLVGNKVLEEVAGALRGCLRPYDMLARMGGDEFVLLLPGMDAEEAAVKRIDLARAVEALNKDFPGLEISISMGSASFPQDGREPERLIAIADRRMYWHKSEFYKSHPEAKRSRAFDSGPREVSIETPKPGTGEHGPGRATTVGPTRLSTRYRNRS